MISIADVLVDTIAHLHDTLATREARGKPGLDAALPLELALAFGDDHL